MNLLKSASLVSAVALTCALAQPVWAGQAGANTPAAEEEDGGIRDIVVTARKRSEASQNVPLAISAFSPELLREKQITNVSDLTQHTSGVTLQLSSMTQQYSIVIRGQNTLDSTLNFDPAIGIYVDGVYIGPDIGNAVALNFDDAASAEVLKGPQGTLYGRNTSGGALKLDHVIPGYEVAGWIKGEVGNYNSHAIRGAVTLPLAQDMASLRLYGRYQNRDGFGKDLYNRRDVNDDKTYSFGGTLLLEPAPNFKVVVRGNYDNSKSGGPSIRGTAILPTTNVATIAIALDNGIPFQADGTLSPANIQRAVDLFYSRGAPKFYDTNQKFPQPNNLKLYNGSATATWDIDDNTQIKSITGYRKIDTYRGVNFSGQLTSLIAVREPLTFRQWSEELTLGGRALDDRLDYTLGLFYLNSKGRDGSYSAIAPILGSVFGAASPIPTGQNIQLGDQRTKSYAAYGQATYKLAEGLNITGGLRYTKEDKVLTTHNRFVLGTYNPVTGFADVGPEVLLGPGGGNTICFESQQGVGDACSATQPFTFKKLTWLGSIDYKITPDVLVYGKISRGFRSGGGQLRLGAGVANQLNIAPFGPETVDDFELGFKSDLFDRKVRANVAFFFDKYKGMQRTTLQVINGAINSFVVSAGKAEVKGVEFDFIYKPVPELTLGWSGAYTDAKYKKYVDGLGNDLSQQKFQGVAKFVSTISAQYKQPTSFGDVSFNVDYWHTSDVPLQPGAGTATSGGPSNTNPWATQKAYGLLNGRIAANIGDKWEIGVWGKNLTQKHYFTYNLDVTASLGYANSWGNAARTFGADATMRF